MAERNDGADTTKVEFGFTDILAQIWKGRTVIYVSVAAFVVITSIFMWLSKPAYQASMIVAPVKNALDQSDSTSLLSASHLFGPSDDVTRFQIYLKRYTSIELAAALERDHHLLRRIYANRWDSATNSWRPAGGIGDFLRRIFGVPIPAKPSMFDLRDYLARHIQVDPGTGDVLQTVTFTSEDPVFAKELPQWVHEEAEQLAKRQARETANSNVEYVNQQLRLVSQTEQRNILINLLLRQENQLMLSQSWNAYAAEVITPPAIPDRPISPNPPLLLTLAVLGGVFLGAFVNILLLFSGRKLEAIYPWRAWGKYRVPENFLQVRRG